MKITRVKPPKYKVGKHTLNEYEVRTLMLEVAKGLKPAYIEITDENGVTANILPNGRLAFNLYGFDICGNLTIGLLKLDRQRKIEGRFGL